MKKIIIALTFIAVCSTVSAQTQSTIKTPVIVSHTNTLKVSKEKLIADPVLYMSAGYTEYKITGFELSYLVKGGQVMGPFVIKGDRFDTKQMSELLSKAKSGDRLYFENIATTGPDNKSALSRINKAIIIE